MCTSGTRLQLAIAPAGAGKTTAMRTLARALGDSSGQVVGAGPVSRRSCAAPRRHRCTGRNAGEAHLVHRP
jgi:ABC-type multidrug transport system ATPase subunit